MIGEMEKNSQFGHCTEAISIGDCFKQRINSAIDDLGEVGHWCGLPRRLETNLGLINVEHLLVELCISWKVVFNSPIHQIFFCMIGYCLVVLGSRRCNNSFLFDDSVEHLFTHSLIYW